MLPTKTEIKKVLDMLPISYYLKRGDVTVELDEKITESNYNPNELKITISYKQLVAALELNKNNETDIEDSIRCVLYHELSHAILTPKQLNRYQLEDKVLIFEDERIESLLRTYFMRVDFRAFVKKVQNYPIFSIDTAETPLDAFFCIVRFREGPQEFLDRVHKLILKYSSYKPRSISTKLYKGKERPLEDITRDYIKEINKLYEDIRKWFYSQHEEDSEDGGNEEQNDSNNTETTDQTQPEPQQITYKEPVDNDLHIDFSKSFNASRVSDLTNNDLEEANIAEDIISDFSDSKADGKSSLADSLLVLIENYKKTNMRNGSAIASHHGRINKRAVHRAQVNHDYKYWVIRNREGNVSAFTKLHLNLFVDVSGSMEKNEKKVNELLLSLAKIEKIVPTFSFDLISMSEGQWIENKSKRYIEIGKRHPKGNFLDETIFETFQQVQMPNANNFNIVLFDGDYVASPFTKREHESKSNQELSRKNIAAFDNARTTIISNSKNEPYLKRYINEKYIITDKYAETLHDEVLKTLEIMLR